MSIKIDGLYEVTNMERLVEVLLDAFSNYPKLEFAFENRETRMVALESMIRFYCAFDLKYGKAYALSEDVTEALVIVESSQLRYSLMRHLFAGSYSGKYRKTINKLSKLDKQKLIKMFMELEELEKTIVLPKDYLYIDFVGVKTPFQGQGKGGKLLAHICTYAENKNLPIMLFTNTNQDIEFYKSHGFDVIGQTHSEKYGFTNTYMLRKCYN